MELTIRAAQPADAERLADLRGLFMAALGEDLERVDPVWHEQSREWFAKSLGTPDVAAFVAETAGGEFVAAALGQVHVHVPTPSNPVGLRGYVSNVITVPDYRGQGLARACMQRLLDWFHTDTGVMDVELVATGDAMGMYERLGFVVKPWPPMRLTVPPR